MEFGERLRSLREKKRITQKELAKLFKIAESTVSMYERGEREPNFEIVNKLANFFGVSIDYLLGRTDDPTPPQKSKPYYALTEKDERDIARDLERMMSDLESNEALIRLSLEHSMRLAKEMAKKKFTPKKYRDK